MNATETLYNSLRESRNREDYEADLAQRTPSLKEVLLKLRRTHTEEIDRLQKRVDAIDKRVDELEIEEMQIEGCRDCGRPASHSFHDPDMRVCISGHEFVGRT